MSADSRNHQESQVVDTHDHAWQIDNAVQSAKIKNVDRLHGDVNRM